MFSPFSFMKEGGSDLYLPTEGLISLYNPAHPDGRTGARINDLYGSADLDITGTYTVKDDNSVFLETGSYADTSVELSSDLEGTGSLFSVVVYTSLHGSGSTLNDNLYGGRWKIGTTGRSAFTNVVAEYEVASGAYNGKAGIGTSNNIFYPIEYKYTTGGAPSSAQRAQVYAHGYTGYPGTELSSSFMVYTKADQNASYTKPATNLVVHSNGFWNNALYLGPNNKTTTGITTWGSVSVGDAYVFDSGDVSIPDVLETNLTDSYLTINPDYSGYGGSYGKQSFAIKGFAVYNRVLTRTEAFSVKSWMDEYY